MLKDNKMNIFPNLQWLQSFEAWDGLRSQAKLIKINDYNFKVKFNKSQKKIMK